MAKHPQPLLTNSTSATPKLGEASEAQSATGLLPRYATMSSEQLMHWQNVHPIMSCAKRYITWCNTNEAQHHIRRVFHGHYYTHWKHIRWGWVLSPPAAGSCHGAFERRRARSITGVRDVCDIYPWISINCGEYSWIYVRGYSLVSCMVGDDVLIVWSFLVSFCLAN